MLYIIFTVFLCTCYTFDFWGPSMCIIVLCCWDQSASVLFMLPARNTGACTDHFMRCLSIHWSVFSSGSYMCTSFGSQIVVVVTDRRMCSLNTSVFDVFIYQNICYSIGISFIMFIWSVIFILSFQCISLPGFRKWPGSGFSLHTWLCLDCDNSVQDDVSYSTQTYRRQLYRSVII